FQAEADARISATFGAVGAIKEALDAGTPCDVVILTQKMSHALAEDGRLFVDSIATIGAVATGMAIRDGDARPDIGEAAALRAALIAAGSIYFPDPKRATAGVHFMNVLRTLGIDNDVAPRLRSFPNGAS